MNILYLDWPCFGYIDILFTFEHTLKHNVTRFFMKITSNGKATHLWMPLIKYTKPNTLIFVFLITSIRLWQNVVTDII